MNGCQVSEGLVWAPRGLQCGGAAWGPGMGQWGSEGLVWGPRGLAGGVWYEGLGALNDGMEVRSEGLVLGPQARLEGLVLGSGGQV